MAAGRGPERAGAYLRSSLSSMRLGWGQQVPYARRFPTGDPASGSQAGGDRMTRHKTLAVAAAVLAALLPVSAAKCGGGTHQGLPVHSRNWWIQNLPPADYIVFGPGQSKPLGEWEQKGWVRRPPGSGQPRIRVWVQR